MDKDKQFEEMSFEAFRRSATDPSLSKYQRIGFPDSYREGYERKIFADIYKKLSNLEKRGQRVLDIGPGCSDLPMMLIELCRSNEHRLTLIDNEEMLTLLPNGPSIDKVAALYPNCPQFIQTHQAALDVILCYSVLHYVLIDTAFFRFIDTTLSMLAPGGQMLLGDIPNVSKRKRFFSSASGIAFHQAFMKTAEPPEVEFNVIEHDRIDDAVVFALLQRSRAQGFDAYVVPQDPGLPMANRREDILIIRP